jgi:acyl carrier protein
MVARDRIRENAPIETPEPISAPSSMTAVGCMLKKFPPMTYRLKQHSNGTSFKGAKMTQTDFLSWIEHLLSLSPGSVNIEATLESINWDSLVNMTFIAAFDEKFQVELDVDKLFEAKKLVDVYKLVTEASS